MTPAERVWSVAVATIVSGAMLSPLRPGARDSFPLSTYPMFTARRDRAKLHRVVAVFPDDRRRVVPPRLVASGDEVMLAFATINRAAAGGRSSQRALCRYVADRAANDGEFRAARRFEFVREVHDTLAYFETDARPLESSVLTGCAARRLQRGSALR